MRVFILCTGRSGSVAITKACAHISNYTSGHETRAKNTGVSRMDYPNNHIEADNRLSWFLGTLDNKFGDEPKFVHLLRNREDTVRSLNGRWHSKSGIIKGFCEGILKRPVETVAPKERQAICEDYYDTVNTNIEVFLSSKSQVLTMHLETIAEDFKKFWEFIGAEGDLDAALAEFNTRHNKSKTGLIKKNIPYEIKLFLLRIWRIFS